MPPCYCTTNNCSGRHIDARTLKKHQQADQQRALSQAIADTASVLHAQDTDISSYIASLALADDLIMPNESHPLLHSANQAATKKCSVPPLLPMITDTCFNLQLDLELLEKDVACQLGSLSIPSNKACFDTLYCSSAS